jgi:alpha-beta hydrolase superfamily lysophospholipase
MIEKTWQAQDGTNLFYRVVEPSSKVHCDILFIHGLLEHGGRYLEWCESLQSLAAPLGLRIWLPDMRGHGRSEGKRGHVERFEDYVSDINGFYKSFIQVQKHPKFVFAHSAGALMTTLWVTGYSLDQQPHVDAWIFCAPAYAMKLKVPKWKTMVSSLLSKSALRGLAIPATMESNLVTRDPDKQKEGDEDPLGVDRVTPQLWESFMDNQRLVRESPLQIEEPALFLVPESDLLIDPETTKKVYENLNGSKKKLFIYKDGYHELFRDTIRDKVTEDCWSWLKTYFPELRDVQKNDAAKNKAQ